MGIYRITPKICKENIKTTNMINARKEISVKDWKFDKIIKLTSLTRKEVELIGYLEELTMKKHYIKITCPSSSFWGALPVFGIGKKEDKFYYFEKFWNDNEESWAYWKMWELPENEYKKVMMRLI